MSKVLLKLEDDYEFELIGVSCHQKDYRLCFELNKKLEIDLQKDQDLVITKNKDQANFSLYSFIDEENHQELFLIANKGTKGHLIPEHGLIDFFIMVKGVIFPNDLAKLLTSLKEIELILAAYTIQADTLKSKKNLLF